jgi:hypothetical protein
MRRILCAVILAAGCSSPPPREPQYDELWDLIGLSPQAREEIMAVASRLPAHPVVSRGPRSERAPSRPEFVEAHRARFATLGLSAATQRELVTAVEFCWCALYLPEELFDEEYQARARRIRELMREFGGMPPFCEKKPTAPSRP